MHRGLHWENILSVQNRALDSTATETFCGMCQTALAHSALNNRLQKENVKTGNEGIDPDFELGSPKSKRCLQGMCIRAISNI